MQPVPRLLLVLAAAITACGTGESAGGAGVRDSAGIKIVENRAAGGPAMLELVVEPPLLDIGGSDRGPDYELSRVVGAVRLRDGRVAVANGETSDIRFFDSAGTFVGRSGRQGGGPGEYQMLVGLWKGPGDSLLAADMIAQRLAVLHPVAGFSRHFSLGGRSGLAMETGRVSFAIPQGWLADGSVVGIDMPVAINEAREGSFRDTLTVIRFLPDGRIGDTVGRFPGVEMRQMTLDFGGRRVPIPTPQPLGRQTVTAVGGDRVFVAANNAWEIEERRADGTIARLIRLDSRPMRLTEADVARHRVEAAEYMENLPQMRMAPQQLRDQITAQTQTVPYPPTLPYIAALLPSDDGTLWVEEFVLPGDERRQYALLDSTGRFLGRVRMPPRFQPTGIGESEVVGIWRDADDVERVRVYRLKKS